MQMDESDAGLAELEWAILDLPPGSADAVQAMVRLGWPRDSRSPASMQLRWLDGAAAAIAVPPSAERLAATVSRIRALLMLGEQFGWAEAAALPQSRYGRTPGGGWVSRRPGRSRHVPGLSAHRLTTSAAARRTAM